MKPSLRQLPIFFFILATAITMTSQSALITTGAGRAGDIVITSREVMMAHMIENALYHFAKDKVPPPAIKSADVRSPEFVSETTTAVLEAAIDLESKNYKGTKFMSTDMAVQNNVKLVLQRLKNDKIWASLAVTKNEVEELVRRKMRTKEFIRFKMESSTIPATDREAEEYFNANKMKFENLPYENFRENIKGYLTKQQVDRRMKDWFELLQNKYQVRNYLAN